MSQADLHVWQCEEEQGRLWVLACLKETLWLVCHLRLEQSLVTCLDFALFASRLNIFRFPNLFGLSRHYDGYRRLDHSGGQLCLHLCQGEPGWNRQPCV